MARRIFIEVTCRQRRSCRRSVRGAQLRRRRHPAANFNTTKTTKFLPSIV
jgi:hypothetical protein